LSDDEDQPIGDAAVTEALERIAKDDPDGLIQPQAVVEAAEDPHSALHEYFEWDDTAAAASFRLVQARHLIARVTVRVVERRPEYVNVAVRNADTGTVRRGYVAMERAVTDPDMFDQVVSEARRGVTAYRNRLSAFQQARKTVAHLDVALASMTTTE